MYREASGYHNFIGLQREHNNNAVMHTQLTVLCTKVSFQASWYSALLIHDNCLGCSKACALNSLVWNSPIECRHQSLRAKFCRSIQKLNLKEWIEILFTIHVKISKTIDKHQQLKVNYLNPSHKQSFNSELYNICIYSGIQLYTTYITVECM